MNRRMFLIGGTAASVLLSATRYSFADPLGLPIGCQTYPVRKSIASDFAGTMKGLRAAGFTQIELCSPCGYEEFSGLQKYKPQELRRMLEDWGLAASPRIGQQRSSLKTRTRASLMPRSSA